MQGKVIKVLALFALVTLVVGSAAWAQGAPRARITGQIESTDGEALPGVTVTFESPNLQGTQVVVSGEGGSYASPPLPPGEYTVTFDLAGYQPVALARRASLSTVVPLNVTLERVEIQEEIVVSGDAVETISETTSTSTTITWDELSDLPINRNINAAVSLNAGVTDGVNGAQISGAQSWDNLYTLNGVVLNENIRGQPFDLFIEDAIQELSTLTSGVSAEYGRFTGGVVNAITKSGGNEFSGSFRTSLTNDEWQSDNDLSPEERTDSTLETYEATLGGRVVRDRVWFFGAGRSFEDPGSVDTTTLLGLPYESAFEEDRYEGKITASMTQAHQLQASYLEISEVQTNVPHGGLSNYAAVPDDGTLSDRELPQELWSLSYTGVLTDNFFVEANYGERKFTFEGGGGSDDAFRATPVFDLVEGVIYNESIFCGVCLDEERNNEQGRAKGTYFLPTSGGSSHDMAFGYETFTDIRAAENHQSANDWMIWNFVPSTVQGDDLFPVFLPGGATILTYLPILNPTQGTDFETQSIFFNDGWRLNDAWSFNLGVRYDATDSVNSNGASVADDSGISPRLGATWNPRGDSPWNFHLYAGRYVGQQANGVFDNSSPAGNPAYFYFQYDGAPINAGGPLVDTETAVQRVFDNVFGTCPDVPGILDPDNPTAPPSSLNPVFNCPLNILGVIPGFNTVLNDGLSPVSADEYKLGFSRQLGNYGILRADVVSREFADAFLTRTDTTTGQVTTPDGSQADLGVIVNSDALIRDYLALDITGNLGFFDRRLRISGTLTLSELEGNAQGETGGSGPIADNLLQYPEYKDPRWNSPEGPLNYDQPVKLRLWGSYDLLRTDRHRLTASLLQLFNSGNPYSAVGTVDTRPFVTNPGYISPPPNVDYYFSDRGAFETDDVTRTDVSLNYGLTFGQWEIFIEPELLNAFNEDSVVEFAGVNKTVFTSLNTGPTSCNGNPCQPFDPFTETPVEGVHWAKGPNFGQPLEEDDLQFTRNWRISVGFRFNP